MCWAIYTLCKKIPETSVAMVGVVGRGGNSVCRKMCLSYYLVWEKDRKVSPFVRKKEGRDRKTHRERERNTCQNFSGNFLKNKKKK